MPANLQAEMNRVVTTFVTRITELARAAARDMIDDVLGTTRAHVTARSAGRRDTRDLERLAEAIRTIVEEQPGVRVEQINARLGTTTRQLVLPIRKMLAAGVLRAKGRKRGRTYFVTDKKAANAHRS